MTPFVWLVLVGISLFYLWFYPAPSVLELGYSNFIYDAIFKSYKQLSSFRHLTAKTFPPFSVVPALLISLVGRLLLLGNFIPSLQEVVFQGRSREEIILRISKMILLGWICWCQARFISTFKRTTFPTDRLFTFMVVLFHLSLYYAPYSNSKLMRNNLESALLVNSLTEWFSDNLLGCFCYLIISIVFVDIKSIVIFISILLIELGGLRWRNTFVSLLKSTACLVVCLLTSLFVDSFYWKKSVIPTISFAKYHFTLLNESRLNALPFNWYFKNGIFEIVSVLAPFIPIGMLGSGKKGGKVAGSIVIYFLFFSLFGQKRRATLIQWITPFICYAVGGLLLVRKMMFRSKLWYLLLFSLVAICSWQTVVRLYTIQRIDPFVQAIQHPTFHNPPTASQQSIYIHGTFTASLFEWSFLTGKYKIIRHDKNNFEKYYQYDWVITNEPKLFRNAFQVETSIGGVSQKRINKFVSFFKNKNPSFWIDLLSRRDFFKAMFSYEQVMQELKEDSVFIMKNTFNQEEKKK